MADFVLVPHRDFPSTAIRAIEVRARRRESGQLDLEYRAYGAVEQVAWPQWKGVGPADRLWEHSCFEAFVRGEGEAGYAELNFATSGQWAAYAFDGYRRGMRAIGDVLVAGGRTVGDDVVQVRRTVELPDRAGFETWRLGLSAVIETVGGAKSYWALAHPDGAPDFHHDICFAARLAAPAGA